MYNSTSYMYPSTTHSLPLNEVQALVNTYQNLKEEPGIGIDNGTGGRMGGDPRKHQLLVKELLDAQATTRKVGLFQFTRRAVTCRKGAFMRQRVIFWGKTN